MEELAEQLISFGLSISKSQVQKLLQAITVKKGKVNPNLHEITLREFLKIFERDPFGDKVVNCIKDDWLADRKAKTERALAINLRSKSLGRSRMSDSDLISLRSYRSQSIISQSSKSKSLYTTMYGINA